MRLFRLMLLTLLVAQPLAFSALAWSDGDMTDSRDPLGLERFPRSWIVDYRRDEAPGVQDFVVGRVERLRRDTRVQDVLRVEARQESALYRIPEGTPVADVATHYRNLLEGGLLFRCAGRDCGRSNEWANQIFGKAILYGPDGNQQYLAWEWQGRLISVYVIERGNRRIYANVQVLIPTDETDLGANALFARRLTAQGWTVIDGIIPREDGTLPGAVAPILAGLGPQLAAVADVDLYLVCHLYGAAPASEALAATDRCAAAAVEQMNVAVPGLRVRPFGAGPFLPRGASPVARLELVVPSLLAPTGGASAAASSAGR